MVRFGHDFPRLTPGLQNFRRYAGLRLAAHQLLEFVIVEDVPDFRDRGEVYGKRFKTAAGQALLDEGEDPAVTGSAGLPRMRTRPL